MSFLFYCVSRGLLLEYRATWHLFWDENSAYSNLDYFYYKKSENQISLKPKVTSSDFLLCMTNSQNPKNV